MAGVIICVVLLIACFVALGWTFDRLLETRAALAREQALRVGWEARAIEQTQAADRLRQKLNDCRRNPYK